MSNLVSKGNMSAFQRWEMASFGDDRASQQTEQKLAASAAARLTEIELEKLRETARLEGYATGYKEAYATAYQEGQQAGFTEGQARVDMEVQELMHLVDGFSTQLSSAQELIGRDLLDLALDLSKAIVKSTLDLQPELIVPIVREAIEQLPSLQPNSSVVLHPDDATIVKQHMGTELEKYGWRIVIDHHIARGGCKIDTPQNLLDASLATRWERLSDKLKTASTIATQET